MREYFKNGFQIKRIPKKYSTLKGLLHNDFKELTTLEKVVFAAYQITPLRKIAKELGFSPTYIRNIYLRACEKINRNK